MILKTNEDIYTLVEAFEKRTIPKSDWTHAAHLVVGLFYCRTLPFAVAKNVMRDGICWLNDTHGTLNTDESGYHETLTVFWMKRIWNYLDQNGGSGSMVSLANDLIARYDEPELPLRYYNRETLYSASARRDYVPPDIRNKRPHGLTVTLCTLKPLF